MGDKGPARYKAFVISFSQHFFAAPSIEQVNALACYVFETSAREVQQLFQVAKTEATVLKRAEWKWTRALQGCMAGDFRIKVYDRRSSQAVAITTRFAAVLRRKNGDIALMGPSAVTKSAARSLLCEARGVAKRRKGCASTVEPEFIRKQCKRHGCGFFPKPSDCRRKQRVPK